ncbi:MAG: hypothetical protein WCV63_06345 [Negativicutes bacterium]|jgi:hypothetical protein
MLRCKKTAAVIVAVVFMVSMNICSAGFFESMGDYGTLARQVLLEQSLPDLQNGVMNISDTTLNQMLQITVGGDTAASVQSINVQFHADNKLSATIKIKQGDSYQVDAKIIQFIHNRTESFTTLQVEKMQILDGGFFNGMKNIFLSMCSVQTLANWYGIPKFENGIKVSVLDNTVTVDFHDWLYKTNIGSSKFLGIRVLDAINVKKVETTEHNMKVYVNLAI